MRKSLTEGASSSSLRVALLPRADAHHNAVSEAKQGVGELIAACCPRCGQSQSVTHTNSKYRSPSTTLPRDSEMDVPIPRSFLKQTVESSEGVRRRGAISPHHPMSGESSRDRDQGRKTNRRGRPAAPDGTTTISANRALASAPTRKSPDEPCGVHGGSAAGSATTRVSIHCG